MNYMSTYMRLSGVQVKTIARIEIEQAAIISELMNQYPDDKGIEESWRPVAVNIWENVIQNMDDEETLYEFVKRTDSYVPTPSFIN